VNQVNLLFTGQFIALIFLDVFQLGFAPLVQGIHMTFSGYMNGLQWSDCGFLAVQASRSNRRAGLSNDGLDPEASSGRLAGTVRRHTPIDTRDLPGAIFHFYVGDLDARYCSFYFINLCVHLIEGGLI
jgi:hypothetical protein